MGETQSQALPIFVGIGGDSGTGKSTLAAAFYDLFGHDRISTMCLDDYHSLDRRERALVGVTALSPRANNFALMEEQTWALKRGANIEKPVYDHSDGTFGPPERLQPREVVIVQGLHPFLVPGIRHVFDLKVWLDPEPELRLAWKIQRDTTRRGYSPEQVLAELEARRPDAERYIQPQRRYADLVVRFFRPLHLPRDMGHLSVRITQRHSLPRLALDQELHGADAVRLFLDTVDEDDMQADAIEIDGHIEPRVAQILEDNIWAHVDERHHHLRHVPPYRLGTYQGGSLHPRPAHSDPLALTQLILAHRILSAQKSFLVRVTEGQHSHDLGDHVHVQ